MPHDPLSPLARPTKPVAPNHLQSVRPIGAGIRGRAATPLFWSAAVPPTWSAAPLLAALLVFAPAPAAARNCDISNYNSRNLADCTRLYLTGNDLSSLPEGVFDGLSNLQRLSLHGNDLSSLPEGVFDGLSNLQVLDLGYNNLSSLPEGVFDGLSNLQVLELYGNNLSSLPEEVFDGLSNLQSLYLSGNDLSSLPEEVFDGLSNLQYLYLHKNQLSSLPEGVFDGLSNLQYLYLRNNQLSSLPEGVFDGLSNLQVLGLRNNQLSSLPEGVFDGLSNLQVLGLGYNNLSSLPEGVFDGLSNLQRLELYGNNLSSLPDSLPEGVFDGLSNLQSLYLNGNDLTCQPNLPEGVVVHGVSILLPLCDRTPPAALTTTITVTDTDLVGGETARVTVTFSESVSGFAATELTADTGELTDFSVSVSDTTTYTATLTPPDSGSGTITLNVAADVAQSSGGTANSAAKPVQVRYEEGVDTPPSPLTTTITVDDTDLVGDETATVTVTFSESVSGFAATELTADTGELTDFSVSVSDTTTYTATLAPPDSGSGTITLNVAADVAQSSGGTANSAAKPVQVSYSVDDVSEEEKEADTVLEEVVLPEVVQQLTAQTVEAITSRLDTIASGSPGGAVMISMEEVLSDTAAFLHGHQEQLSNGQFQWQQAFSGRNFVLPLSDVQLAQGDGAEEHSFFSSLAVWGGGDYSSYGNKVEGTSVDGDGFSGTIGIDVQPTPRLVTGLALTMSRWGLDYDNNANDATAKGTYKVGITMVNPYVNWFATDRLSLWGTFGYGRGEVEQDPEAGDATSRTDSLTSWAGGARFQVLAGVDPLTGEGSPLGLAFKVDGAASSFLDTNVQLARLAAEVSRSFSMETGLLTAALELGWSIRSVSSNKDDRAEWQKRIADKTGDGGAELAGSLNWLNAEGSMSATVDGRVLLGGGDQREWGIGGNLRLTPSRRGGEGLSLSLQPSVGVSRPRLDDLWSLTEGGDLAVGNDLPGARLDAEVAYGIRRGNALLTPYTQLHMAHSSTTTSAGLRYALDTSLNLDLSASHRNRASGNTESRVFLQLRSDL